MDLVNDPLELADDPRADLMPLDAAQVPALEILDGKGERREPLEPCGQSLDPGKGPIGPRLAAESFTMNRKPR
jgi:hypothetical protein